MALFSLLCQEQDPFSHYQQQPLTTTTTTANEPLLLEPFSDDFIASLVTNEQKSFPNLDQTYLCSARKQAMQWTATTCSRLGFGATTVLLAANYLDRCFLSSNGLSLQLDKPWMTQLSAVACLSLATKVEESYVPFLLDLQTSSSPSPEYLFEPKTVKRMELLALSTLQWKMNPVTALSFVQCVLSNLRLGRDNDPLEILRRCEAILLSVVADWRWVRFPPSVWASAALLHANVGVLDELQRLMDMLQISKERVEECHGIILEIMGYCGVNNKRKSCYCSSDHEPPPSPNGVISSSCFSYESFTSSLDPLAMWPNSISSSPEPPPPAKRPHLE
ncbi:cyclin-D3-3-like [Iris pallida]|uniref:Cyclin-D3-3-like n=1 Tax=Iris pallida TaxID=29817 RepID=A0AAX6GU67_IRIPA|nr:cyclin-D3-3-like [Iris pallida]